VGKGKRAGIYLEVRKRRGHIFFEVQYDFFIAQKLLFANQYVRKWNVTCISSGQ
jgi:hypothetical protein